MEESVQAAWPSQGLALLQLLHPEPVQRAQPACARPHPFHPGLVRLPRLRGRKRKGERRLFRVRRNSSSGQQQEEHVFKKEARRAFFNNLALVLHAIVATCSRLFGYRMHSWLLKDKDTEQGSSQGHSNGVSDSASSQMDAMSVSGGGVNSTSVDGTANTAAALSDLSILQPRLLAVYCLGVVYFSIYCAVFTAPTSSDTSGPLPAPLWVLGNVLLVWIPATLPLPFLWVDAARLEGQLLSFAAKLDASVVVAEVGDGAGEEEEEGDASCRISLQAAGRRYLKLRTVVKECQSVWTWWITLIVSVYTTLALVHAAFIMRPGQLVILPLLVLAILSAGGAPVAVTHAADQVLCASARLASSVAAKEGFTGLVMTVEHNEASFLVAGVRPTAGRLLLLVGLIFATAVVALFAR